MKKSRSIVGIAVVVSSIVLIGAGIMANRTIEQLSATSDAVLRAKEIELDFERLLSALRDAETGQRGYLLTNEEAYLEPYQAALRDLEKRVSTLTDHVQADGGSVEELAPLAQFVERKLEELANTVELKRAGEHAAAIAVVRSDEGKVLMDGTRAFVAQRVFELHSRVARLQEVQRSALTTSVRTSLIVSALAVALTILLAYIVRRDSARAERRRRRADAEAARGAP